MYVEVDLNPSPSKKFFISIGINDAEALSFDNTEKGCRIIKQKLVENKNDNKKEQEHTSNWEVVVLKDAKFVNKYHVNWIDNGKIDKINNEIWQTISEKSMPKWIEDKLLKYSRLISDNYQNLSEHQSKVDDFWQFIKTLARDFS